jgi:hypothetical protein
MDKAAKGTNAVMGWSLVVATLMNRAMLISPSATIVCITQQQAEVWTVSTGHATCACSSTEAVEKLFHNPVNMTKYKQHGNNGC